MKTLILPRPSEMDREAFVDRFGPLYEHSPWVAEAAFDAGLSVNHDTIEGLSERLAEVMLAAPEDRQKALIRAHPDLAGKVKLDELTADSREEQGSAGLDRCTREEYARFQELNETYKDRFGFPFVIAVRGLDRHKILEAFELRVENDPVIEFMNALHEINKIARLRLEAQA
ncbi:MAG: 2-oxo-4-hydroxy-4-carboxy-5-ureidoimidazoline decarboxylase [Candidatus Competibacterales bacterium]|nr:2-oxo-4-hydroxy-4-carboxy-5-ureidoimidazoline decarboxylase [Candidatus Competibacterales bacterium]